MMDLERGCQHRNVLLVSPVGFSHGWVPSGILVLRAGLRRCGVSSDTLMMSIPFSAKVNQDTILRAIDETIGEWGYSFHEAYHGALLFGHVEPTALLHRLHQLRSQELDIYGGFGVVPCDCMGGSQAYEADAYTLENIDRYCRLLDEYVTDQIKSRISTRYRAVFFSCNSAQLVTAMYMARLIREMWLTQPLILVGGAAVTQDNVRQLVELCPHVNGFLPGPSDERCLNALTAYGVSVAVPTGDPFCSDLECAPETANDELLDPHDVEELRNDIRWPVWQSWGCSWAKCTFCTEKPNHFRLRSVKTTIDDILAAHARYGVTRFGFVDPDVNGDLSHFHFLCRELADVQNGLEFWCEFASRNCTRSLFPLMLHAGFAGFQVGIESFSAGLLRKMRKPARLIDNVKCLVWARHVRFDEIYYNLIAGHPEETESDLRELQVMLPLLAHLLGPPFRVAVVQFECHRAAPAFDLLKAEACHNFEFFTSQFPIKAQPLHPLLDWREGTVHPLWKDIAGFVAEAVCRKWRLDARACKNQVVFHDTRQGRADTVVFDHVNATVARTLGSAETTLTIENISMLTGHNVDEIRHCLSFMEEKNLVFREDDDYIPLYVMHEPDDVQCGG